jgi:predicted glycosyltransferase
MRFLFYSHDGLGLGHTRRNLAIATALAELAPDTSVLLTTGIDDITQVGLPDQVGLLKLPSLRKTSDGSYVARRLHIPASEIRALRSALLLAAVKSFRPSVVLVDKHPFGASGEFRAALELLCKQGGHAVLGLRDILDDPQTVQQEWGAHHLLERMAHFYDLVLVYGHSSVFNPIIKYDFPAAVAQRTHFCGYVVNEEDHEVRSDIRWAALTLQKRTRPVVLATTGGGEDGFFLLETFIRTAERAPWQGVVVAGPMTPEHELKTLQRIATEANVTLYTYVPSLSTLFWSVDTLVCMGGYNTLAEAVSKGVPSVCVPRISPRSEQLIRALAFERLGFLNVLHPEQLNVEMLRQKIEAALQTPREQLLDRANAVLRFDGARQAASHLLTLASPKVATPAMLVERLAS